MVDLKETLRRRGFLGTLAATTALGIAGLVSPRRLAAEPKNQLPEANPAFDAWLNQIKGKHKQVFDSPNGAMGMPFAWARVFQITNEQVGVPKEDITTVLILRHASVPWGMVDGLWSKYKFGEVFKINDPATKAPAMANGLWKPKGTLPVPGMSLDQLIEGGVLVGICDMALTHYSMGVATNLKLDPAEVKKDWVGGIFPGIQIVPSGVLAVNRAQEHGCTYCYAGEE